MDNHNQTIVRLAVSSEIQKKKVVLKHLETWSLGSPFTKLLHREICLHTHSHSPSHTHTLTHTHRHTLTPATAARARTRPPSSAGNFSGRGSFVAPAPAALRFGESLSVTVRVACPCGAVLCGSLRAHRVGPRAPLALPRSRCTRVPAQTSWNP